MLYILFSILIIIVCILLILIVLVQNSKGGGLASGLSGSNQFMGVRRTTDFLEKATWSLAAALLVFSLLASLTIPRGEEGQRKSKVMEQAQKKVDPNNVPTMPTQQQPQGVPAQ